MHNRSGVCEHSSCCGEAVSSHAGQCVCGTVERLSLHMLCCGEDVPSLAGQCVWGSVERVSLHMLVSVCAWGCGEAVSSHAHQ